MDATRKLYVPSNEMADRVQNSFICHSPKEDQIPRYNELRETGYVLALKFLSMVPPGREQATAISKLEEAIMWANKGIACGEKE